MGGGDNEIVVKTELDTDGFEKGSKKLAKAIDGFFNSVKKTSDTLKKAFGDFKREAKEAGGKTAQNVTRGIKKIFGISEKGVKEAAGGLKRYAGLLLGVGSVYGIISKAVSTFMSQNQKLSAQMSAIWTALGNVLGPIITQIINWVSTAVSYFLEFLRLLGITGKTASQLSKKANDAAGGLKRTLAGFDELNLLNDNSGYEGRLEDKTLDDITAKIADLLKNKMWDEAADLIIEKVNGIIAVVKAKAEELGHKIGEYLGGAIHIASRMLKEIKWKDIGAAIANFFNALMEEIDGKELGSLLISAFVIAFNVVVGFLETLKWSELADFLIDMAIGAFDTLADEIEKADWTKIGDGIREFLGKLWDRKDELADALFKLLKAVWDAAVDLLCGIFGVDSENRDKVSTALSVFLGGIGITKGAKTFANLMGKIVPQGATAATTAMAGAEKAAEGAFVAINGASTAAEAATLATVGYGSSLLMAAGPAALAGLAMIPVAMWDSQQSAEYAAKAFSECGDSTADFAEKMNELADKSSKYDQVLADSMAGLDTTGLQLNECAYAADALTKGNQMLAEALGITVDELNRQLEAANGDYSQIEAVRAAIEAETNALNENNAAREENIMTVDEAKAAVDDLTAKYNSQKELVMKLQGANKDWSKAQERLDSITEELNTVTERYNQLTAEQNEKATEAANAIDEMAETLSSSDSDVEKSTTKVEDFTGSIEELIDTNGEAEKDIKSAWSAIADGVSEGADRSKIKAEEMGRSITSSVGTLGPRARGWGYDIGIGIGNGMYDSMYYVQNAAISMANTINSYLAFSEPEKGPLSDFHTYMPDMVDLMVEGIEGSKGKALQAVSELAGGISAAMQEGENSIGTIGPGMEISLDRFADKIVDGFNNLLDRLQTIADNVFFQMPAMAGGGVIPYGIGGGNGIGSPDDSFLHNLSDAVYDAVSAAMENSQAGNGQRMAVLEVNGREFCRAVFYDQQAVAKEHGISLITNG